MEEAQPEPVEEVECDPVEEIQRETPVGWFNYAHSYASSAQALSEAGVDATHPEAPISHLYRHAIELYLKSFLLLRGISPEELRQKYRHNTARLVHKAWALGLEVTREQRAQIAFLKNPLPDRYLETGCRTVLPTDILLDLCRHLNSEICPQIYDAIGVMRRPATF